MLTSITEMKNKIFKLVFSFIIISLMGFYFGDVKTKAYEAPYYGEVPAGQIKIVKKVKDPANDTWADNLSVYDYRFAPGEEVVYLLTIENKGEVDFDEIKINDYLPDFLELSEGELEKVFNDFEKGEVAEYEIKAKVVNTDQLPVDQGLFCLINKAEVIADDQGDEDTAQICVESKVLGASIQPEAGVNLLVLAGSLVGFSVLGFCFKKK